MYQAFGSYVRNKNGKPQKYFSFRLTEQITAQFPWFFKEVWNSDNCLHLIRWVTLLPLLLTSSSKHSKILDLHQPTENAHDVYKAAAVSWHGQNWTPLLSAHALGSLWTRHLHYSKRAPWQGPLFTHKPFHQLDFPTAPHQATPSWGGAGSPTSSQCSGTSLAAGLGLLQTEHLSPFREIGAGWN